MVKLWMAQAAAIKIKDHASIGQEDTMSVSSREVRNHSARTTKSNTQIVVGILQFHRNSRGKFTFVEQAICDHLHTETLQVGRHPLEEQTSNKYTDIQRANKYMGSGH